MPPCAFIRFTVSIKSSPGSILEVKNKPTISPSKVKISSPTIICSPNLARNSTAFEISLWSVTAMQYFCESKSRYCTSPMPPSYDIMEWVWRSIRYMISRYKYALENRLQPIARGMSRVNPNFLTLIGIIPQVAFFILMQNHLYGWALLALACSIIDMLDGLVARAHNKVSAFGGFLDSIIDRLGDFFIIAGLYVGGLASLLLSAILLLAAFLTSYTRSRGNLPAIGLIERTERVAFIFLAVIIKAVFPTASISGFNLSEVLILILAVLSVFTVCQRVWYAYKHLA